MLNWEPKTQLREGLIKTIAYFENVLERGVSTRAHGVRFCARLGRDNEFKPIEVHRLHSVGP